MSKIINDLQRFQVPYDFAEVPELQKHLESMLGGLHSGGDVTALYRQSLLVEPRRPSDASTFGPAQTSRGDMFNWKGSSS